MASHSVSLRPRRVPRQPRGERRVARLLDAAASVIARDGYEAATMSAIAEHAGASIGSLYQFFPNKLSITQALRSHYGTEFNKACIPLTSAAKTLNPKGLAAHLIVLTCEFADTHPAFPALLDAPLSTRSPAAIRRVLQERFAGIFQAQHPRISKAKAMQMAAITLQMMKVFSQSYSELDPRQRRWFVREFKTVLCCYFSARLATRRSSGRRI